LAQMAGRSEPCVVPRKQIESALMSGPSQAPGRYKAFCPSSAHAPSKRVAIDDRSRRRFGESKCQSTSEPYPVFSFTITASRFLSAPSIDRSSRVAGKGFNKGPMARASTRPLSSCGTTMSSCWRLMPCWHCMLHLRNGVIVGGRYAPLLTSMIASFATLALPAMGINIVHSPDPMKIDEVFCSRRTKAWTVSTQL
jgi:hypothetical protein